MPSSLHCTHLIGFCFHSFFSKAPRSRQRGSSKRFPCDHPMSAVTHTVSPSSEAPFPAASNGGVCYVVKYISKVGPMDLMEEAARAEVRETIPDPAQRARGDCRGSRGLFARTSARRDEGCPKVIEKPP